MKVGDKITLGEKQATITRLRPLDEFSVEVEFTGSEWFYPYRAWFLASELR
jgi:hypothetical protein